MEHDVFGWCSRGHCWTAHDAWRLEAAHIKRQHESSRHNTRLRNTCTSHMQATRQLDNPPPLIIKTTSQLPQSRAAPWLNGRHVLLLLPLGGNLKVELALGPATRPANVVAVVYVIRHHAHGVVLVQRARSKRDTPLFSPGALLLAAVPLACSLPCLSKLGSPLCGRCNMAS